MSQVMKTPQSNFSGPIVVDPLTRIEGHLRIEVEVENGRIKDARSCGTLYRGLEVILKGRDPRDAQHFTQRTCGVCTYTHALASTRALEDAMGLTLPANATYIRNLVLGLLFMHDHMVHFYHLHALDFVDVTAALKADPRLKNARVYLLGWSEGTMIAPKVAQRGNVQVDALLLAGYCNGTMDEALEWQQSGASSMLLYSQYFDYDGDGAVSEAEFAEDRYQLKDQLGSDFTALDADGNGALTIDDFAMLTAPFRREMLDAIKGRDDQWLKENYSVQLTSGWFLAHRAFQPNREMLAALYLPIHIFHGTADLNVSVQGVYDIESTFQNLGKTNLTLHVFPGMDHDLNYLVYPLTGGIPESFTDLFQTIADLD